MNSTPPITDLELHAYVDGQLPPQQHLAMEQHLRLHPDDALRVALFQAQKQAIRRLYQPVLNEPVPSRLRHAATARSGRPARQLAAAVVLALVSGAAGWGLKGSLSASPSVEAAFLEPLAQRAAVAHAVFTPEVKHPVEVGAAQEDHLIAWLSKRLGHAIQAPRLQGLGYALEGGRLLPGEQGPVAQLMYRDSSGQRLTVYISTEPGAFANPDHETAFRFSAQGPINVFYWVDHQFGYAISSRADRGTLAKVSTEIHAQLNPSGS
jgi:anti-sigma factor RsiW